MDMCGDSTPKELCMHALQVSIDNIIIIDFIKIVIPV